MSEHLVFLLYAPLGAMGRIVVLWARMATRWSLGQFVEALRRPHFTLYFGRKACPLGVPLDPRVIEAGNPRSAIHAYLAARTPEQTKFLRNLDLGGSPLVLA